MRISGGSLRGRTICAPKGLKTRPTSDFLRQVAFNLLGGRILHANVLDLFAGSGAFGLDALSRGADRATFVEQDRAAVAALSANLAALELASRARVVRSSVHTALRRPEGMGEAFDVVFLDPPYGEDVILPTLESLASGNDLGENSFVLVQAFHKAPLPERMGCLHVTRCRRHGESCLALYTKESVCPERLSIPGPSIRSPTATSTS
jgi:16S rRNA (guanine966-N2)-methyltransferase